MTGVFDCWIVKTSTFRIKTLARIPSPLPSGTCIAACLVQVHGV